MTFTTIPLEQTTAITDLLVAVLAAILAWSIYKSGYTQDKIKTYIWSSIFGLLALAALLGTIVHGFEMTGALYFILWQPLNIALGLTIGLFFLGVVYDLRNSSLPPLLAPLALIVTILFYTIAYFANSFMVFIIYESLVMLFALLVYFILAYQHRLKGAWYMTFGVLISIIAALLQTLDFIHFKCYWEFDHNGIYHLVQILGLIFLYCGLRLAFLTR